MDGIFDKFSLIGEITRIMDGISVSGARSVLSLAQVYQMLATLKTGLTDEDQARKQIEDSLKKQLAKARGTEMEEGGDTVGGETYQFDFGGAENDH